MSKRGGHVARQHGQAAEQAIKDLFDIYERTGIAVHQWTYPIGRLVRNGNNPPMIVYTGGGVPDVSAIFNIGGTGYAVWFDVKTTTRSGRLTLKKRAYDQCLEMEKAVRTGGLGFFLVLWRHEKNSKNAAIDEWRVHSASSWLETGEPVIQKNDWKETITLTRKSGELLDEAHSLCRPTPRDNPWDSQIYLPNLADYVMTKLRGKTRFTRSPPI